MGDVGGFGLVATDLDGTALRPWDEFLAATGQDPARGRVDETERTSPRLRAAVAAVRARGVPFVVVTGRSRRSATTIASGLGADRLICSNGALVWDLAAGRVDRHVGLPVQIGLAVVDRIRAVAPAASFFWETVDDHGYEADFLDHIDPVVRTVWARRGAAPLAAFAAAQPDATLVKIGISLGPGDDGRTLFQDCWDEVVAAVGPAALATAAGDRFVELGPPGMTKAVALAEVAAEHGVPASAVLAFGDERNDVPMLAWAGHGVAMGDARDEVKAVAAEVTGTAAEDGVAVVLERLLASADPT